MNDYAAAEKEAQAISVAKSEVIQVEDRYFMVYRYKGNTEYQETIYDVQPDEVYPVEKTIIVWEGVPKDV